jgi:hypothetical protein
MWYFYATAPIGVTGVWWQYGQQARKFPGEGIIVSFDLPGYPTKREAANYLQRKCKEIAGSEFPLLDYAEGSYLVDLTALKRFLDEKLQCAACDWMSGKVAVEPEIEEDLQEHFPGQPIRPKKFGLFFVTKDCKEGQKMAKHQPPPEIQASLAAFKKDHPDPGKVCFIMMRFGKTTAHDAIVAAVRDTLRAAGIEGLRADDKDYSSELWLNILTYIHGSSFAVAVFERLEGETFNPNVALEVGYVMALGANVCLLKDKTLRNLQADLVGKLYKEFDPQNPGATIPPALTKWMKDRGIIP